VSSSTPSGWREALPWTSLSALLERYETFLLDAYGVLVHGSGALPGAAAFLETLRASGKRRLLLSNDASRLAETTLARMRGLGLELEPDELLNSGMLIAAHFEAQGLRGAGCAVLGTADSIRFVEQAGGEILALGDPAAEVLVVADDEGYPFVEGIERALNGASSRLERGAPVHLLLPNPDLIYPRADREIGLAAGAAALLIEQGLAVRFGAHAPRFHRLGKPHRPIFEAALKRLGDPDRARVVMLGDQLGTDVRGANEAEIDSVLLSTGLTRIHPALATGPHRPTWILAGLEA